MVAMRLWQAKQPRAPARTSSTAVDNAHELSPISLTDPLTEALNRRGFEDRLGPWAGGNRGAQRAPLTLVVLDLDRLQVRQRPPGPRRRRRAAARDDGPAPERGACARTIRSAGSAETSLRCSVPPPASRTGESSSTACATRSAEASRAHRPQLLPGMRATARRRSSCTLTAASTWPKPAARALQRRARVLGWATATAHAIESALTAFRGTRAASPSMPRRSRAASAGGRAAALAVAAGGHAGTTSAPRSWSRSMASTRSRGWSVTRASTSTALVLPTARQETRSRRRP